MATQRPPCFVLLHIIKIIHFFLVIPVADRTIAFRTFSNAIATTVSVCRSASGFTIAVTGAGLAILAWITDAVTVASTTRAAVLGTIAAVFTGVTGAIAANRTAAAINRTIAAVFSAFTGAIATAVLTVRIAAGLADAIVRAVVAVFAGVANAIIITSAAPATIIRAVTGVFVGITGTITTVRTAAGCNGELI